LFNQSPNLFSWDKIEMPIEKIKVSNFKSFNELEVELGNFNVLIGANASGKSNFLEVFGFLSDVAKLGLNDAISLQGGFEYLSNASIGHHKSFSLEIVYDPRFGVGVEIEGKLIGIKVLNISYSLTLELAQTRDGLNSCIDKRIHQYAFVELERQNNELREREELGAGWNILRNDNGEIKYEVDIPERVPASLFPSVLKIGEKIDLSSGLLLEKEGKIKLPPKTSLLESPLFSLYDAVFDSINPLKTLLDAISIYDFDPKIPKKAVPLTGKAELEKDGSNLAIVLKNILEDDEKRRKFANLINYLLPFVEHVQVENLSDKSVLLNLQESYNNSFRLPAAFISDGTIQLIALIIALYFEEKPLVIIEEPERNIHPHLISKVVTMLEEASQNKQIIVTTHNPEIIKHTKLENILLVSRDSDGFSEISRPGQREEVKIFLENEIGVEELYVQNLLGV